MISFRQLLMVRLILKKKNDFLIKKNDAFHIPSKYLINKNKYIYICFLGLILHTWIDFSYIDCYYMSHQN